MKKLLFLALPFRTRFLAGPFIFFFVTIGFVERKVNVYWLLVDDFWILGKN